MLAGFRSSAELTAPFTTWFLAGPTGCHREGQGLLTADGYVVNVEDVKVGDMLAGPGGEPREVHTLIRGVGPMVQIIPTKGAPFVVNRDHILSVIMTDTGEIHDLSVATYLQQNATFKHCAKLFRSPAVDWRTAEPPTPNGPLNVDPYFIGVLLGDGCLSGGAIGVCTPDEEIVEMLREQAKRWELRLREYDSQGTRCPTYRLVGERGHGNPLRQILTHLGLLGSRAETKRVPLGLLRSSRRDRLELLAGLIDTDGYVNKIVDFISKSRQLSEDVVFLARSVGLAAYMSASEKYSQHGTGGVYWRVSISGNLDQIPTRVKRKQAAPRRQIKNVLRTGFIVEQLPLEEYYFGFVLDGDGRYLLDDFTVTHNCGKTTLAGTFPHPYFIVPNNENSMSAIAHMSHPYIPLGKYVNGVCTIRKEFDKVLRTLESGYQQSVQLMRVGQNDLAWTAFPMQTIVVESLAHFAELVVEDIAFNKEKHVGEMDQSSWGKLSTWFRGVHARLSALQCHIVYTSLIDPSDSASPFIQGRTKTILPSSCDVLAYMDTSVTPDGQKNVRTWFVPCKGFNARTRLAPGRWPPFIDNMTFDHVRPLLEG